MSAELIIRPGQQFAGAAEFVASQPPYSIAVEAVAAPPQFLRTEDGPYLIIDHHEGVERRVTAAACEQAWDAANRGLSEAFRRPEDDIYYPEVVVRDCDQDVSLSYYVLDHAARLDEFTNQEYEHLGELVRAESKLDTFGGIPPDRITPRALRMMERIAWIFDAYTDFRASRELYRADPESHRRVIASAHHRIGEHISGQGQSRSLDMRYELLGKVAGCAVIKRLGAEALLGAYNDDHRTIIAWQSRPDGNNQYTYYRSEFAPFDLLHLYQLLNEAEGCAPGAGHGGSTTIGGSPLEQGSTIEPGRLLRLIAANPQVTGQTTR